MDSDAAKTYIAGLVKKHGYRKVASVLVHVGDLGLSTAQKCVRVDSEYSPGIKVVEACLRIREQESELFPSAKGKSRAS